MRPAGLRELQDFDIQATEFFDGRPVRTAGGDDKDGRFLGRLDELRFRGEPCFGIEDDAGGLADRRAHPGGQQGIVGERRPAADDDGIHPRPQFMAAASASGEVIHFESPDAVAIRPSSVMAHLAWT